MRNDVNKLKIVWDEENKFATKSTTLQTESFNEIINSLMSLGPFYFYIIDFFDMSLSYVSPSIKDIHGFDPATVTFDDILNTIHPEDMGFVSSAEKACIKFVNDIIGFENVMNYKTNYSFRSRMHNGEYCMLNHQAIVLTTDNNGGVGKAINIHTNINHITKKNCFTFSLIGLKGNPSYTDINVIFKANDFNTFSKREIEIIRLLAKGDTTLIIAKKLFISEHTVNTHRKNINIKANCKNSTELIDKCVAIGLI